MDCATRLLTILSTSSTKREIIQANVITDILKKFNNIKFFQQNVADYKKSMLLKERVLTAAGINVAALKSTCVEKAKTYRKGFDLEQFKKHIIEIHTKFRIREFPASVGIFFMCVVINTFAIKVLSIICADIFGLTGGSVLGFMLAACLVAPIVEETAKKFALKAGIGNTFIVTFVYGEYILNGVQAVLMFHAALLSVLVGRTLSAIMHFYTFYFQKYNIDITGKESKTKDAGYRAGVAIHSLWNTFGMFRALLLVR